MSLESINSRRGKSKESNSQAERMDTGQINSSSPCLGE